MMNKKNLRALRKGDTDAPEAAAAAFADAEARLAYDLQLALAEPAAQKRRGLRA